MTALDEIEVAVDARAALARKLVEVALEVESIEKTGFNRAQNYAFATAETMLTDLRAPLLARGILVLAGEDHIEERIRHTSGGTETAVTTVHLTYTLLDSETGAFIELQWLGRGEDPMDKGVAKALTNAEKTFLRKQFMLPWAQDDPEADEGSDARAGRSDGTVNLASQISGSGLTDTKLNEILVGAGLAAQSKPFATFMRIPAAKAEEITAAIEEAKGA